MVTLYKSDIFHIYQCDTGYTDWSQIPDHANGDALDLAPGTIIPWDMQASSGTHDVFYAWAGNPTLGSCVRKLVGGAAPFENDVKPLLADANTTATNVNNMIWWMSYGDWATYPYTRNGVVAGNAVNSKLVAVANAADPMNPPQIPSDGNTNDDSYAILRTLYLVTKNGDADCRQTAGSAGTTCDNVGAAVYGTSPSAGKSGAIRQYVQWLCRLSTAQHTTDSVTGVNYKTEINSALGLEGFQPVLGTDRTTGYGCSVST